VDMSTYKWNLAQATLEFEICTARILAVLKPDTQPPMEWSNVAAVSSCVIKRPAIPIIVVSRLESAMSLSMNLFIAFQASYSFLPWRARCLILGNKQTILVRYLHCPSLSFAGHHLVLVR